MRAASFALAIISLLFLASYGYAVEYDLIKATAAKAAFFGETTDPIGSLGYMGYPEGPVFGDADCDGYEDDLIICHPYEDAKGRNQAGAAYLILDAGTKLGIYDLNTASSYDANFYGAEAGGQLCYASPPSFGDADSDGCKDDVVFNAYGADPKGLNNAGEAYLVKSVGTIVRRDHDFADANSYDANFYGANGGGFLGYYSKQVFGDADSDGYEDDLIVFEPQAPVKGKASAGIAYLMKSVGSTVLKEHDFADTNSYDANFYGGGVTNYFGYKSRLVFFDADSDGEKDDVIFPAEGADPKNREDAGMAYLVLNVGSKPKDNDFNSWDTGHYDANFYGGAANDNLNYRVPISVGDADGDGYEDDAIFCAPDADPKNRSGAGECYLVIDVDTTNEHDFNTSAAYDANFYGAMADDVFGYNAPPVFGDADCDGEKDDVIISSYPAGASDTGASYLVKSAGTIVLRNHDFADANSYDANFYAIAGEYLNDYVMPVFGDADSDGCEDDVVFTAPDGDPKGRADAGISYLVKNVGAFKTHNFEDYTSYDSNFYGGYTLDYLGMYYLALGDADADGIKDDLVIPAYRAPGALRVGVMYLFDLGPTPPITWWNSDWQKKFAINNMVIGHDLNVNDMIEISGVNFASLGSLCSDASDIRVVNEETLTEVTDLNFHNWDTTITDTDVNILFKPTADITAGTYNGKYYIYSANLGCPANTAWHWWQSSFDTFEDSNFTQDVNWLIDQKGGTSAIAVDAASKKEGSFGLHFTYALNGYTYIKNDTLALDNKDKIDLSWWMLMTDCTRQTKITIDTNAGIEIGGFQMSGDILQGIESGAGSGVFAMAPADNTWYKLRLVHDNTTKAIDYYLYNENGAFLESATGLTATTAGAAGIVHISPYGLNGAGETYIDNASFAMPFTTSYALGAEEGYSVATGLDVNAWRVEGYDDILQAYPTFSYANDGNLTIDFKVYNKDNNRMVIDINYSTASNPGTGTIIIKDLNLTSDVCPNQNFTAPSSCHWDFNIAAVSDNNYFILFDMNSFGESGLQHTTATTSKSFHVSTPNSRIRFLDENTNKAVMGLSVLIGSQSFTTPGDGIIDTPLNISGPMTITVQAWQDSNYGVRYFEFDVNASSKIDANLAMLRDVNGIGINFKFYEADETTTIPNARIYAHYSGKDANLAGARTTDASGETSFFLNPDGNYYFVVHRADDTEMRYNKVQVTSNIPKDEDVLSNITPYGLYISGLASKTWKNQNAAISTYIFSNTASPYVFDYNGGILYYPRTYEVKVKGNPAAYTIQPYLAAVTDSGNFIFNVIDATALTPLQGITILIKRTIPGEGTVEVASLTTDAAGKATLSLLLNVEYDIYFYYGTTLVHSAAIRPTAASLYYQVALDMSEFAAGAAAIGNLIASFFPAGYYLYQVGGGVIDINISITLQDKNVSTVHTMVLDTNNCIYDENNFAAPWADGNYVRYKIDLNRGTAWFAGSNKPCIFDSRFAIYAVVDVNSTDGNTFTKVSIHYTVFNAEAPYEFSLLYGLAQIVEDYGSLVTTFLAMLAVLLSIGSIASVGVHDASMLSIIAVGELGFFCFIGWVALMPFLFIAFASVITIFFTTAVID